MNKSFVIKGNICQTLNPKELDLHENSFAICVDGVSKGVFDVMQISLLIDAVRYFIVVMMVGYLCPILFKKIKL